jgi:hypothetical protein
MREVLHIVPKQAKGYKLAAALSAFVVAQEPTHLFQPITIRPLRADRPKIARVSGSSRRSSWLPRSFSTAAKAIL